MVHPLQVEEVVVELMHLLLAKKEVVVLYSLLEEEVVVEVVHQLRVEGVVDPFLVKAVVVEEVVEEVVVEAMLP